MIQENLSNFKDSTWRLNDVVTESLVLLQTTGKVRVKQKLGSRRWKASVRIDLFDTKNLFTIFFKDIRCSVYILFSWGKTIPHQSCIKGCIKHPHDNTQPHVLISIENYFWNTKINRNGPFTSLARHSYFSYF